MTNLVINSDDFGYSKAINFGIVETHLNGVLTSTTMMANMPGFVEAIKLAQEVPKLGIGAHLSLTCGRPVLNHVDQLVGNDQMFKPLNFYKEHPEKVDLDQLYEEWEAQIQKLLDAGIKLTHLDTHHYIHSYGKNYQVIDLLARKYQLPVRNCFGVDKKIKDKKIVPMDDLWNVFNKPELKDMTETYPTVKESLFQIVETDAEKYANYCDVEAVVHPGYLDSVIWYGSSFNLARLREIDVLCDPSFKQLLDRYEYNLVTYENYH